ncbi:MAG: YraN family protein [Xanthomonadales bacterium]|nr:YraN family protein [Xanthomonadales bacterium]
MAFRWWWTKPFAALAGSGRARGQSIEGQAAQWLRGQGLILLERNYQIVGGEIDLVMREAATIVFVEVRYRRDPRATRAVDSVGARKRQLLLRTAQSWLAAHPEHARRPCRFDVLGVEGEIDQLRYQWVRHAFDAGG